MIIGVLSRKGGVGKTTLAVHLAAMLARQGKTLLVDEDETRNATTWSRSGKMPFTVAGVMELAREAPRHEHVVIDSRGGMDQASMRDLYKSSDVVVIPVAAEFMTMTTLVQTLDVLRDVDPALGKARVVLTMTRPGRKLEDARTALADVGPAPIQATVRYSEAFRDATEQGVLVRDVRGNRLAKSCWQDCEEVFRGLA
ncbi:ParA family protein [Deinococcus detaillensis]|uniref:ParA family protein n=1 Tax=Deinococcus detaillensis TaxID=2592048 RepID=A0A553UZ38_9DEIO|nr:ParA family protein [Deinococcus detaillensis]TSA85482.1 ParA family protein [Deinococcus detaillensis]